MNQAPLPFNPVQTDPDQIDVLMALKRDILLSLNCHHVGTIQSFNSANQTATATINYVKTFVQYNQLTGTYTQTPASYPVMLDCPVICLGGGPASLTFPIEEGDECLVLFNDRDIGNWFQGSSGATPPTARMHSFSDGIILVGVRSLPNVLEGYDSTRAVLSNGTTMVGVGPSLVKIANATTTLNTILQQLITQIGNLVTQCAAITIPTAGAVGTASPPANASMITSIGTSISSIGTALGGLLE